MKFLLNNFKHNIWIEKDAYFLSGLFIIMCVFFSLGGQKDIWFCDEVYTYMSANADSGAFDVVFSQENEWLSGDDVVDYLSANDRSLHFKSIADNLFSDHVPLYFFLFRICSILSLGTCSKWIGLSLNLLFFIVFYACMWKFFHNLAGGGIYNLVKLITILAIMFQPIVLSETLTIRMYLMFSVAQILFLLILNKDDHSIKGTILLCLTTIFGMLTHFYFWIWLLFFSVGYFIYLLVLALLKKNGYYPIISYVITMICSLFVTTLIFPNWITNIFFNESSKGNRSLMKILELDSLKEEMIAAIKIICSHLSANNDEVVVFTLFVITMAVYVYLKQTDYKIVLICISSVIYAVFVQHTQPSEEGRYLWSSSILLYIAFLYMLLKDMEIIASKYLKNKKKTKLWIPLVGISCFLLIAIKNSINLDNIIYLRNRTPEQYQAIKDASDLPWIVFHDNTDWVFLCSMYDFTIPEKVKRCGTDVQASYDEVIENSKELIVYTIENNKTIDECLQYITDSCDKKVIDYEQISQSYAMSVYHISLQAEEE